MARRFTLLGLAFLALIVLASGVAEAGRFGGAFRGPYEDRTTAPAEEDAQPDEAGPDSGAPSAGKDGGSEQDPGSASDGTDGTDSSGNQEGSEGAGNNEGNEGSEGNSEEGRSPSSASGPDPQPSEDSGPSASEKLGPAASNPSPGIRSLPGQKSSGKVAPEDTYAYWPFWFEHNKEWILAELLESRKREVPVSPRCSSWFFIPRAATEQPVPITGEVKATEILPVLLDLTKHRHEWVRDAAVLALGKLGLPEVVAALKARAREDSSPAVRQDALIALGLCGQKDALDPLLDALDRAHGSYAALGLALLGRPEAVPDLIEAFRQRLRKGDAETAACVAVALGHLRAEAAVAPLSRALRYRGHHKLQVYVCHALGRIGSDEARKALGVAMAIRDQDVQAAAVLALSAWKDSQSVSVLKGRSGLKSGHRMSKLFALVSLARISRELTERDPVRKSILVELQGIAERPVKEKYMAMYASLGIAMAGYEGSNKYFAEFLLPERAGKYSPENHSAMAMASGFLGNDRAVASLRAILDRSGFDADFRGYAAFALGVFGDRKSKDAVKALIAENRQRHQVLRSSCWALALLGDPSDADAFIDVLKRDDKKLHEARGAAALGLGLIGDLKTARKLLDLIEETGEDSTRAFAIAALGCLVDPAPSPRMAQLFANSHYREEFPVVREVLSNL